MKEPTEVIKEVVEEAYDRIMEIPYQIFSIFQEFFGEGRVDIQGFPSKQDFHNAIDLTSIERIASYALIRESDAFKDLDKEVRRGLDAAWEDIKTGPFTATTETAKTLIPCAIKGLERYFFGDIYILVHFPWVRVTNEYDRYVDIRHLWVRVPFTASGKGLGYFQMNRSHYPVNQFNFGYMHSHISGINLENLGAFKVPCTGDGPIRSTLGSLTAGYDASIWQLLCLELDRFVRVESIEGAPYIRLENIPSTGGSTIVKDFNMSLLSDSIPGTIVYLGPLLEKFILHILESGKLKFNYRNGSYGLATSFTDTLILLSNEFISWWNSKARNEFEYELLAVNKFLHKAKIIKGHIHLLYENVDSEDDEWENFVGEKICTFQGRDILLEIEDDGAKNDDNIAMLLNPIYISPIIGAILEILNYKYEKDRKYSSRTTPHQETKYL